MPVQLSAGEVFVNGQQVDQTRLNNHVNGAIVLKGAITEQAQIESPTLASDDKFLVVDTSADTLRKVNASSLVQSNLPVISSLITSSNYLAKPNEDVSIVANDGVVVTGKTFTSVDGINVTITSTAHGLVANQVITVTASIAAYSGKYKITSVTVDTIVYALSAAVTIGSGTCNYQKAGTVFTDDLFVVGDEYVTGNLNVAGTVKIGNKTPLLIEDAQYKTYVKSGFVTPAAGTEFTVYTSPTLTIPADETWTYQIITLSDSDNVTGNTRPSANYVRFRVYNNATQVFERFASNGAYGYHSTTFIYSKALTSIDNGFIFNVKMLGVMTFTGTVLYQVVLNKVKTASLSDVASCI